jgi:hypothetical protein
MVVIFKGRGVKGLKKIKNFESKKGNGDKDG